MGRVVTQAVMSLDGYVAEQDNTIGGLFDWLQDGDVEARRGPGTSSSISTRRVQTLPRWSASLEVT